MIDGLHRSADHKYRLDGAEAVPGITTPIGVIDKGWSLVNWNRRTTALAALKPENKQALDAHEGHQRLHPLCPICNAGKPWDKTPEDRAATWLATFPGHVSQEKMDLGSEIHDVADQLGSGQPVDWAGVSDAAMPYVESWIRDFAEGVKTLGGAKPQFDPRRNEFMVYRKRDDLCLAYAGTMDTACRIGDDIWLIDYKSGSGIYPEVRLQLAAGANGTHAYQLCPGCRDKEGRTPHTNNRPMPMPEVNRYGALHIRPDGCELKEFAIDMEDFHTFAAARFIYERKKVLKWR